MKTIKVWINIFLDWTTDKFWWMKKVWDFFRYDIPCGFSNFWYFKKAIWNYRNWDFHYTLQFILLSITQLKDRVDKGYEIDETKNKKVKQMGRVIELLKNHTEDNFFEQAEKVHGKLITHPWKTKPVEGKPDLVELIDQDTPEEKEHNRKVFDLSHELENDQWNELWNIIKGNQENPFANYMHEVSIEEKESEDCYNKWFTGVDGRGWWS